VVGMLHPFVLSLQIAALSMSGDLHDIDCGYRVARAGIWYRPATGGVDERDANARALIVSTVNVNDPCCSIP
jgi:hypothetical protein